VERMTIVLKYREAMRFTNSSSAQAYQERFSKNLWPLIKELTDSTRFILVISLG